MKPELTPWFDGRVAPARKGFYEINLAGFHFNAEWSGIHWWVGTETGLEFSPRNMACLEWRGLANDPAESK